MQRTDKEEDNWSKPSSLPVSEKVVSLMKFQILKIRVNENGNNAICCIEHVLRKISIKHTKKLQYIANWIDINEGDSVILLKILTYGEKLSFHIEQLWNKHM